MIKKSKNFTSKVKLDQSLSLSLISFYGIGTILGAGIYVLIGKISGVSGSYLPMAFLLAAIIVSFTGYSYAELARTYPYSAGSALYVEKAFSSRLLGALVGWGMVGAGLISASAINLGFINYLQELFNLSDHWQEIWVIMTVVVITIIASWGIKESVLIATLITITEIFGILLVIFCNTDAFIKLPNNWHNFIPLTLDLKIWESIFLGSFLAFYAYIGFEDLVNISEETKNSSINIPLAIYISIIVTTIMYLLLSIVAVLNFDSQTLYNSKAPLVTMISDQPLWLQKLLNVIGIFAIINGSLLQAIMCSRVLYGMSEKKIHPKIFNLFAYINPYTKTPIIATIFVGIVMLMFTLLLPIVTLAKIATGIILLIFVFVNLSAILIKKTIKTLIISGFGVIMSLFLLLYQLLDLKSF